VLMKNPIRSCGSGCPVGPDRANDDVGLAAQGSERRDDAALTTIAGLARARRARAVITAWSLSVARGHYL